VRVLLVGAGEVADRLAETLSGPDVAVERVPEPASAEAGAEEIAAIAKSLLEFEDLLAENGPAAVVLASRSDSSLAALLVATKLGLPTAFLEPLSEEAGDDVNARLIGQLADMKLAVDAEAILAWLRDAYTSAP